MSLASTVPKILAGSATAGFGLSLGRDIYKSSKNNGGFLLAVFVFIVALWLYVQSWTWMFRNYKTLFGSILIKVLSVATLALGAVFTGLLLAFIGLIINEFITDPSANEPLISYSILVWLSEYIALPIYNFSAELLGYSQVGVFLETTAGIGKKWIISIVTWGFVLFAALGIKRGISQRKQRRLAWEAEAHNYEFMNKIGLAELGNNQFIDEEGNRYRLENEFNSMLELFPLGRRNKRAYIEFDETGKFTNWTGIVKI